MKKALAILACFFIFAACGADDGTIYDKQHHEGYYKTVSVDDYMYLCTPQYDPVSGSVRNDCRNQWVGSHNEQRWVEECYEIKFRNSDGDEGSDCVGEALYNDLDLGDYYKK